MMNSLLIDALGNILKTLVAVRVCGAEISADEQIYIEGVIQSTIDAIISTQPKVMTQEELEDLDAGNVVWLEQRDENRNYLMPMIKYDDGIFENRALGAAPIAANLANTRFWSAKPSDEQCCNTPWT